MARCFGNDVAVVETRGGERIGGLALAGAVSIAALPINGYDTSAVAARACALGPERRACRVKLQRASVAHVSARPTIPYHAVVALSVELTAAFRGIDVRREACFPEIDALSMHGHALSAHRRRRRPGNLELVCVGPAVKQKQQTSLGRRLHGLREAGCSHVGFSWTGDESKDVMVNAKADLVTAKEYLVDPEAVAPIYAAQRARHGETVTGPN